MYTTNLRKVGGSIMLVIPPAFLDQLHLQAGATVGLVIDNGRLIVEPQVKPHYTLTELLAQCGDIVEFSAEDRAWIDAKPVGRELL